MLLRVFSVYVISAKKESRIDSVDGFPKQPRAEKDQVTLDKQITVGIVSQQRINEMYAGRKGAVGQSRILCRAITERNAHIR